MEDIGQIQLYLRPGETLGDLWASFNAEPRDLKDERALVLRAGSHTLEVWPRLSQAQGHLEWTLAFERAGQTVMKSAYACAYASPMCALFAQLLRQLVGVLPDTPMFLSDEAGDGQSWGALESKIPRNRWWFDWAYVPKAWSEHYQAPPSTHLRFQTERGEVFVREPSWVTLPWSDA